MVANIARASGVAVALELAGLPLSEAARRWLARQDDEATALVRLATGGDDYEIVFTIRPERLAWVTAQAREAGCPVSEIGRVEAGAGVTLAVDGELQPLGRTGWRHR